MPKEKGLRYRTRGINPGYYQKLAFKGDEVVAVSGYLRKKGKDKKIYELRERNKNLVKVGKDHWRDKRYSQEEVEKDYASV